MTTMADSKYADLPGIAYDQVDVYETTDLPESEQYEIYPEDETGTIELLHINATEAFTKFKGKQVTSQRVDFSDRISHKPRIGYNTTFGEWEVPGTGENETPIQKYQRLQSEIKELFEEINNQQEKAKTESDKISAADIFSQVKNIEQQLNSLKLHESIGLDLMESLSDPQGTKLKNLISQIESFKGSNDSIKSSKDKKSVKPDEKCSGTIQYQMMYLPEKTRMQQVARIAQLEQRLCCLENVVGTTSDKLVKFTQDLKCQGVMKTVQELAAKAALLDANHIDTMEKRLAILLDKMDNISQKKSSSMQNSEQEQKIAEMYDIIKKTESMSEVLPQTVNRMMSLNTIHQQAAGFSKSLAQLEELQEQITTSLNNNKSLLQGVQESFASNLEIIKSNMVSLDERIKKIQK